MQSHKERKHYRYKDTIEREYEALLEHVSAHGEAEPIRAAEIRTHLEVEPVTHAHMELRGIEFLFILLGV